MFSKTNASLRSQIFALLLFFPFSTFAAYDINLAGQVLDASNAPIPGVEVQLKDSDLKAVSDSNGQWTLVHSVELYNNPASIQEGMRRKSLSTTSSIYNVMGRQLEDSHLAQGVYILRESVEPLLQHSQYLAKFAGEMDSLIVSYQGSVVGRIAVADPLQADPLRMTLVTVSPLVSPAEAQGTASAYTTLVGQQVQVNFQYDELLWGPTWLSVGNTKTAATGKTFSVLLSNATDSVTLALVSRKQTIAWGSLDAIPYGSPDFKVNATVESQLAVSVKSNTPAVCTVSDSWVHLVAVGTCELVASQAGNDFYAAASDVTQSFVVNPREITVFVEDKSKVYGTDDPALTYRAPGLLPGDVPNVVLQRETGESANSYVIDGSFLHPNYHATIVKGIFRITPVPLHIKSANLGTQASLPLPDYSWFTTKIPAAGVLIAHSYEVEPALPADVTVSYKSTTPSVCTYDQSSAKLTLLDSGACTIQAITTPANYESPSQTFLVNQFRDARDQQVYGAVQIGNQIWMSRNLNYSRQETLGYCYQNLEDYKFDSTWHRDTPYCNPYGRCYFLNEAMNVDKVYHTNNSHKLNYGCCIFCYRQ